MACLTKICNSTAETDAVIPDGEISQSASTLQRSTESIVRSTESIVAAPSNSERTPTQSEALSIDSTLLRAMPAEVNEIKSKPAPKSLKRKWIDSLREKVGQQDGQDLVRDLRYRIRQNVDQHARSRSGSSHSSQSSNRDVSQQFLSSTSLQHSILLSPKSSQATLRSPSTTRNTASSTPKRKEDPRKVIVLSNHQIVAPNPTVPSNLATRVTQISPPPIVNPAPKPIPKPPTTTSANPHSNAAAPRRYNSTALPQPSITNQIARNFTAKNQGG